MSGRHWTLDVSLNGVRLEVGMQPSGSMVLQGVGSDD